jgi:hypothetical protein
MIFFRLFPLLFVMSTGAVDKYTARTARGGFNRPKRKTAASGDGSETPSSPLLEQKKDPPTFQPEPCCSAALASERNKFKESRSGVNAIGKVVGGAAGRVPKGPGCRCPIIILSPVDAPSFAPIPPAPSQRPTIAETLKDPSAPV